MSVWICIPSARPVSEVEAWAADWIAHGYRVSLWRDKAEPISGCMVTVGEYPGYSAAVNRLIADTLQRDPGCEFIVLGGDDTQCDQAHTAEEIARQCSEHFKTLHYFEWTSCKGRFTELNQTTSTFGVMQPTGDRWAKGSIDKIAGSPWIGREFARRMYQGNGPLWPAYTRFFMDQELQDVAIQYGVFQQRPDLVHLHRHYMRRSDDLNAAAFVTDIPPHLVHQEIKWDEEKKIFLARKNARPTPFPGSEPIA